MCWLWNGKKRRREDEQTGGQGVGGGGGRIGKREEEEGRRKMEEGIRESKADSEAKAVVQGVGGKLLSMLRIVAKAKINGGGGFCPFSNSKHGVAYLFSR